MSRNTFITVLKFLFSVDYVIWGCFVSFSCLLKCPLFKVNGHFLVLCHWIISTMGQGRRNSCNPCLVTCLIFWILSFFFQPCFRCCFTNIFKEILFILCRFHSFVQCNGDFASDPNERDWIRVHSYFAIIFSLQSSTFRLLFRSYSQMSARDMN